MAMLGPMRRGYGNGRPIPAGPPMGPNALRFKSPVRTYAAYMIAGVTRDSTGAILGNCSVDLFYATGDKQRYANTVSDANGNYSFLSGDNVSTFFAVAYLPGGTTVAGTTLQTLQFV